MTIYPQLILDALKTVRYPGTGKTWLKWEWWKTTFVSTV